MSVERSGGGHRREPAAAERDAGKPGADEPNLLEIRGLRVHFNTYAGVVQAIEDVTLEIRRGETLGLVGESGCGKSITALSIMRLVPQPPGEVVAGEIRFRGKDLLALSAREMESIRGNAISMIFQEPMTSLNPVLRVGEQIMESILRHQELGSTPTALDRFLDRRGFRTKTMRERRKVAAEIAVTMLKSIGIPDAAEMMQRFPHELSGGMRQRVMIAMALACDPALLIADEPTTALDVTIQAQIIELMKDLKKRVNASILLITHHLGVVAEMCDRVAVMYAGHVVEVAPVREVFKKPMHPYTLGLLNSIPKLGAEGMGDKLPTIAGSVPDLIDPPKGCRFHPRCPFSMTICTEKRPELVREGPDHKVACHLYAPGVALPVELARKEAAR